MACHYQSISDELFPLVFLPHSPSPPHSPIRVSPSAGARTKLPYPYPHAHAHSRTHALNQLFLPRDRQPSPTRDSPPPIPIYPPPATSKSARSSRVAFLTSLNIATTEAYHCLQLRLHQLHWPLSLSGDGLCLRIPILPQIHSHQSAFATACRVDNLECLELCHFRLVRRASASAFASVAPHTTKSRCCSV